MVACNWYFKAEGLATRGLSGHGCSDGFSFAGVIFFFSAACILSCIPFSLLAACAGLACDFAEARGMASAATNPNDTNTPKILVTFICESPRFDFLVG